MSSNTHAHWCLRSADDALALVTLSMEYIMGTVNEYILSLYYVIKHTCLLVRLPTISAPDAFTSAKGHVLREYLENSILTVCSNYRQGPCTRARVRTYRCRRANVVRCHILAALSDSYGWLKYHDISRPQGTNQVIIQ